MGNYVIHLYNGDGRAQPDGTSVDVMEVQYILCVCIYI